ncbi:MAG: acyl carrier protein [Oleiphilus sp.]
MSESKITPADALEMIADALNEDADDVKEGGDLEALDGWDSMGVLMLMAEFDERFGLTLEEEEIKSLKNVDDILALLTKQGCLDKS